MAAETGYTSNQIKIVDTPVPDQYLYHVTIEPGDPFDHGRLLEVQLALSNSGYFGSVEVRPERDRAEERRVPIVVVTEPAKPPAAASTFTSALA